MENRGINWSLLAMFSLVDNLAWKVARSQVKRVANRLSNRISRELPKIAPRLIPSMNISMLKILPISHLRQRKIPQMKDIITVTTIPKRNPAVANAMESVVVAIMRQI